MKHIIYLVGQITSNPESYEWRQKVVDYFRYNNNIEVINPCNSEFNSSALRNNDNETFSFSKKALKEDGIILLPHKDRRYVKESTCIFANMNLYSDNKPIIGSFFELAWAFDDTSKLIIGILDGNKNSDFICRHPFVAETIQVWVKKPIEACKLLERYMD